MVNDFLKMFFIPLKKFGNPSYIYHYEKLLFYSMQSFSLIQTYQKALTKIFATTFKILVKKLLVSVVFLSMQQYNQYVRAGVVG